MLNDLRYVRSPRTALRGCSSDSVECSCSNLVVRSVRASVRRIRSLPSSAFVLCQPSCAYTSYRRGNKALFNAMDTRSTSPLSIELPVDSESLPHPNLSRTRPPSQGSSYIGQHLSSSQHRRSIVAASTRVRRAFVATRVSM